MKILFLANKNFVYSNYIINLLLVTDVFDEQDQFLVLEQDWVIPKISKGKAFKKYLRVSGFYYVMMQIIKKILFVLAKQLAYLKKDKNNPYYPYYKRGDQRLKRVTPFNNLKSKSHQDYIKKWQPDLIISVYSMEIIPNSIIDVPKFGVLNIHPSLLPKYRGVAPVIRCLANNDPEIGITLYYIDKGIDTGNIIEQKKITTDGVVSDHELTMQCVEISVKLLFNFIDKVKRGEPISTSSNESSDTKYYSIPTKQEIKQMKKNGYKFFTLKEFFQ